MDDNQIEALKTLKDSFEEIGVKLAWVDPSDRLNPITKIGPTHCPPGEVPEPCDVAFFGDGKYIALDNTEISDICFCSKLSEDLLAAVILKEKIRDAYTQPLHTESKS